MKIIYLKLLFGFSFFSFFGFSSPHSPRREFVFVFMIYILCTKKKKRRREMGNGHSILFFFFWLGHDLGHGLGPNLAGLNETYEAHRAQRRGLWALGKKLG